MAQHMDSLNLLAARMVAARPALEVPATPDAQEAREAAQAELAKPAYHPRPNLLEMVWKWITEHLNPTTVIPQAPPWLSAAISVLLLGALLIAIIALITRITQAHRVKMRKATLFEDDRDAATLTRVADAAAAQGDFATAVVERFRAIIRSLDERGLIEDYPGMTAHEAAVVASVPVAPFSDELHRAAELFDAVRYGEVASTPAQDEWMRSLARAIDNFRPSHQQQARALAEAAL